MKSKSVFGRSIFGAVFISLWTLSTLNAGSPVHAASTEWISSESGDCQVWKHDFLRADEIRFRWNGECKGGKVHGYGVMQFLLNGREYWTSELSEANGASFVDGKMIFQPNPSSFEINCGRRGTATRNGVGRRITLKVPNANVPVWQPLKDFLGQNLVAKCPMTPQPFDYKDIEAVLLLPDGSVYGELHGTGSLFEAGKFNWTKVVQGPIFQEKVRFMETVFAQVNEEKKAKLAKQKELEATQRAAAVERARQLERERVAAQAAARQSKTTAVFNRFGIKDGWARLDLIEANVFAHEGKSYLMSASFDRMMTRDSGVFSSGGRKVLVVGVPTSAFTDTSKPAVLGVLVLAPSRGEAAQFVKMKYLGHEYCSSSNCAEFAKAN